MAATDAPPGYLIRGHGVYVWGAGIDAAMTRLEALEFMLLLPSGRGEALAMSLLDHLRRRRPAPRRCAPRMSARWPTR